MSFVVSEFFPQYPVSWFTSDPKLTKITIEGMRIIVLMSPVVGFQIVVANFFQSIGMAKKSIFISVSRQLVFLIPFLIVFPEIWGTNGVWLSITAADGICTIIAAIMLMQFYKNKRKLHIPEVRKNSVLHRIFFHNRVTP